MQETITQMEPIAESVPIKHMPPLIFADVCGDHGANVWRQFGSNPDPKTFRRGVMTDVHFRAHVITKENGCGGEYEGHALGHLRANVVPTMAVLRNARRLAFDKHLGEFTDALTGEMLINVSTLVLADNLHARYVP